MGIVDNPAFRIYRGQRKYDDEQPLNKNTPNLDFPRAIDDPAPYIVVVQGPPNVGKSLLIKSLVEKFTKKRLTNVRGPITIPVATASGKEIRLQFVECPNDINGMIDAAKYADVAILMVDASYGFEMETFEFRNLLQAHGFPKVIGVLTHLDKVSVDKISGAKQRLEDHFCTEICEGAKLSSLSGLEDGLYKMPEIDNLGEMLSVVQSFPLSWRAGHPYVLVDCFEDVTPETVHGDKQSNRNLRLYGYLRGCNIKKETKVHIAGAGDFSLAGVTRSHDPCPLKVDFLKDFDRLVEQSHFKDYKTGTYLRLDVLDVPSEIVENFDPHHPILIGGILLEEENYGYMQVKLRRHSWHFKLLMTGAPITVSAGWRRYQTTAIYAMKNKNGQHRLLDYTPEHKDCFAVFWGPLSPPKTRIVAVLSGSEKKEAFRITAKGVVLDIDHGARILQEVEKIGIPVQICGKTAYIKFAPELKIDRFIGATIQTKCGIRGKINKAERQGLVKCKFKDNIYMDDTFFYPVLTPAKLPLPFKHFEMAAADVNNMSNMSLEEVALRQRQMIVLRRRVVIHEGKCKFHSFPNPLELYYLSKKLIDKKMAKEERARRIRKKLAKEEQISGEVNEKHSLDQSGEEAKEEQISREVKEKHSLDRSGEEAKVIDDYEAMSFYDREVLLYLRRYGKQAVSI